MTGRRGRRLRILLAAALLALAPGEFASAGIDVSLEREYERLADIERRVEEFPAYRESEDLKQQVRDLQAEFERLASEDSDEIEAARARLTRQIDTLQRRLDELSKVIVDFREQLSQGEQERFFPRVRHRIAAFTFDDPHGTGLGDPISFILSKKLLFSTRVSSFAIVNYRQGVERQAAGKLAYFDRVDAVTQDQGFLLAIWGRLSETKQGARIESFLQVPDDAEGEPFVRRLRLPEAMGSGVLTVRLKPDRVALQKLDVGAEASAALRQAAAEIATLRAEPEVSAEATGRLGEGQGFREDRAYRIVDSRGKWVRLQFDGGGGGWTSVEAFCTGPCAELLKTASFANDVIALSSGLTARPVPDGLTDTAGAVAQQLEALVSISDEPRRAIEIAEPWAAGRYGSPPPGGAGFANLLALARITVALDRARTEEPAFDRVQLDRETVAAIARDLAEASVADPGDLDVVENLAVLFDYLGDDERRDLALKIAEGLKTR